MADRSAGCEVFSRNLRSKGVHVKRRGMSFVGGRLLVVCWVLTGVTMAHASANTEDVIQCRQFLEEDGAHKTANENESCLRAADTGVGFAQYSVGMGFGYEGRHDLEKTYYRMAANNRIKAAYLALGHTLKDEYPWCAIY